MPAGFFQYYRTENGDIGIDQFLSQTDDLNRGLGTEAIRRFIRLIVQREAPSKVIIDPVPNNHRAIRCYEKVGFRHRDTVPGWNGEAVFLMELELTEAYNKCVDSTSANAAESHA